MGKLAPLARSSLGRGLQIGDVCRLAKYFSPLNLKANQKLFSKGEEGEGLFLICQGTVELSGAGPVAGLKGKPLQLGQGDVLGEFSLLRDGKRMLTAKAKKKTSLLALNRKDYQRLGQEAPQTQAKFARNVLRLIGDKCAGFKDSWPALTAKK